MTLSDALDHIGTGTKYLLDFVSITVALGAIVQLLPPLAAAFTIAWTGLQIYGWFEARRERAQRKADKETGQ